MKMNGIFALTAALACVAAAPVHAQSGYPSKPIRIVVPTSPGSAGDTFARILSQPLSERLGQPVVVEARPGGGTVIGTEIVARAAPDGHTLLVALPGLTITPSILKTLPYDPLRDFAGITQGISQPNLFVVHPSLPAKNTRELIALARAHPGEMIYASSGVGSASHLTVELFLLMTKTRMLHVPYKGPGPGVIDLVAGRVALMAASTVVSMAHVKAGRLRPIGVSTVTRVPSLPDIPTIAESGVPGYEAVSWFGLAAPAGTPKETIARLNRESVAILRTPAVEQQFAKVGSLVVASSAEAFDAYIRSEAKKWAKVVKAAGIKAE
jgi:tripartite-type tricarboxylate transporter receptor subunit TctC